MFEIPARKALGEGASYGQEVHSRGHKTGLSRLFCCLQMSRELDVYDADNTGLGPLLRNDALRVKRCGGTGAESQPRSCQAFFKQVKRQLPRLPTRHAQLGWLPHASIVTGTGLLLAYSSAREQGLEEGSHGGGMWLFPTCRINPNMQPTAAMACLSMATLVKDLLQNS